MTDYEVTSNVDHRNDTLMVKFCTFDKDGRKRGFIIQVTEEWLRANLVEVAEGECYPCVRANLGKGRKISPNKENACHKCGDVVGPDNQKCSCGFTHWDRWSY